MNERSGSAELEAELERYKNLLSELHTSGERYRAIVASSDDAIISKDLDGMVTSWNPGAERIFGFSEAEMVGQPLRRLIPPEHQDEEDRILATVRRGERVDHFETVRLHKDGSRLNLSVTISPIKSVAGEVIGASKVGRDITMRMRESDLRNRLSAIVESSDDAIISKDLNGTITSWNHSAERILGYTAQEAIGRSVLMLIPEDLRSQETEILQRLRRGERIKHFRTVRRHKSGSLVDLSLTISPIRNEQGVIIGASKVARDMSGEERAAALVQESEQKFTAIFKEAPIGMVLAEMPSGRLVDANPAFLQLIGGSVEDFQGRSAFGSGFQFSPGDQREIMDQLRRDGHLRSMELTISKRNGERMTVMLNANLMTIMDRPYTLMHVEDVTDRRRAEAQLQETARRKDEFLATLAHELRNPLAPLATALQILEMDPDDAVAAAQARAIMNRQMQQLVHLVDDLMDLSRVSRGVIDLQRAPLDLRTAVVQAIEATRPLMQSRGHIMKAEQPPLPLWVNGDNTRLVQVFSNLLNNAAKYTDHGGRITITTTAREGKAVVEVCDNGTGIEPANLGKVFDMFAQLENATTRKQGGLGIGLSIVKQMVSLHGGEVRVRSAGPGKGTTFTVHLPLGPPPPHEQKQVSTAANHERLRVLITDDNVEAATTLSMLVRKMGHAVCVTHSGQESLMEMSSFQPHVLFLDIGMPGMDGYDTCRCVRGTPAGMNAYVVALTGWGQEEDKRLADEAGFDQHVVKPITKGVLQTILDTAAATVAQR